MAAVRTVSAGLEVIDSRYRDFRFTLPDVVADNASSARFAVGDVTRDPRTLDLGLESRVLREADAVVATATGAAVQGHPANAEDDGEATGRRGRGTIPRRGKVEPAEHVSPVGRRGLGRHQAARCRRLRVRGVAGLRGPRSWNRWRSS